MSFYSIPVALLLPPQGFAVLALLALLLLRRRGRVVAAVLLVLLMALATPIVSQPLLASLDPPASASEPGNPPPGAIVILSADVVRTGEPGATDLGPLTLERERAGAALARRTKLPVLVTGGIVTAPPAVGTMMGSSMANDFGIPVRWVESRSGTTWENARFSVPMLKAAGVQRIYLVTHAWHMRRSLLAFRRAGIEPVAAPVRTDAWPRWRWKELLPTTRAWRDSYFAFHEWVGLLYYRLRP